MYASYISLTLVTIAITINILATNSESITRGIYTSKSEKRHKFISFDTDDDTIEMAVEFSVPFLQIPKSLGKFSSSLARGENPATINFGAILLLSIIALIGTIIGTLRAPDTQINSSQLTSLIKMDTEASMESVNLIWTFLKKTIMQDRGMLNDCVKKFACLTTMETSERRRRGENSLLDNLIEGVSKMMTMGSVQLDTDMAEATQHGLVGDKCNINGNCSVKIHPLQHYLVQFGL